MDKVLDSFAAAYYVYRDSAGQNLYHICMPSVGRQQGPADGLTLLTPAIKSVKQQGPADGLTLLTPAIK